ncbi:MAG TPA: LysM domain-containing protein [Pirellulales bacterium]|nr:LysM domain-containing protein [Pirellulales bacterium]
MKGKEVKIGLSVIGVLLCVFGVVLFTRLRDGDMSPKIAAKQTAKAKDGAKKKNSETTKTQEHLLPRSEKPATSSRGGPSLRLEVPAERRSFANSGPTEPERDGAEASSRSAKLSALAGPFGQDGAAEDEPAESVDRYGRRYGLADDVEAGDAAAGDSGGRYSEEPGGATVADEMPANGLAGDETAAEPTDEAQVAGDDEPPGDQTAGDEAAGGAALSLGAGRNVRFGQPADGYRTVEDETAEESAADAADDPFPSASPAPFAIRGPAQGGSLKTSSAEVQLAPIDETAEETLAADESLARPAGEAAASGAYVVQSPNDSFAAISKKVYGTEGYFKALHEYNREHYPNPNLIDIGDEIAVPDVAVLQQAYPGLCPKPRNALAGSRGGAMRLASRANSASARGGRPYLVAEGDTLFDIAKRELGKASRWKEIYDLNQDQLGEDFNYLSPGTELLLPGKGDKPDPVADAPLRDRRRR